MGRRPHSSPYANVAGRRRNRAFVLAELIAILLLAAFVGAVAISAYRTYAVRAQVTRALADLEDFKHHVEKAFHANGEPPSDTAALALPTGGPRKPANVERVAVVEGRIDVTFSDAANAALSGRRISLTPYETAALRVVWICGNRVPGPGLQPLGFAAGSRQAVQIATTIDARYLPSQCR